MILTKEQKKRLIKYLKKTLNLRTRLFQGQTVIINRIEAVTLTQVQIKWEYQTPALIWKTCQMQMSDKEYNKIIEGVAK